MPVTTATVNDYGKLIVVLVTIVGGLVVAIVGLLVNEPSALASGTGLAGTAIGYTLGNGRLAVKQDPPSTMLAPTLVPGGDYVHRDELEELAQALTVRDKARVVAAAKARRAASS